MDMWHTTGRWNYDARSETRAPTPDEIVDVFDELDTLGDLSADSRLVVRRLYDVLRSGPCEYGHFVQSPGDDAFDAEFLRHVIDQDRLDALLEDGVPPTDDELEQWREIHMERASMDEAPGLYGVHATPVSDSRGRCYFVVTLHVDADSLEQVVGLFRSMDEVTSALSTHGRITWA